MFGLLRQASPTRKLVQARTVRLGVERLEDRLCLSGGAGNQPETLTLFFTYGQGKQVTLYGQLTNPSGSNANQAINLGGVVNGTAMTNSQGAYTVTLPVAQLGQVTATAANGNSNTPTVTLVGGTPTISNFVATSEEDGLWDFSGTVSNAPAQGEVVNFSGIKAINGQQTSVNTSGSFSVLYMIPSGGGGLVDAQAVDWWGDTSPFAATDVTC